jgi:3-dehydroquinate dehydratase-2
MKTLLILNGPNLNMLGQREPEIYGKDTLADIQDLCEQTATKLGYRIHFRQSNHEGQLVDWVQEAAALKGPYSGLILNAAAYTHTSIAIHDALKLLSIPVIEVHISDPAEREPFRHHSYVEPLAAAVIKGQGAKGYALAIERLSTILQG